MQEPLAHHRGEIRKDEIDGQNSEIGFLEIRFSHVQSAEADGVLRAFRVDVSRLSDQRQKAGRSDHLSLGFRDFGAPGFDTRSSFGV